VINEDMIEKGSRLIGDSKRILVFSGAGLSTESGIPDFRSPGGIWDRYDPSEFYYDRIISDKKAREKYWKMSSEAWSVMKKARPNRSHLAIRVLEDMGKLLAIVTQNIDSLHHRAGNSPEKIIEIHGTASSVVCLSCGRKYDRDIIEERLRKGDTAPSCDACSGILKPATVSFGQAMPQDKMDRAFRHATEADLCMVLGSSLVVYPAASIPAQALRSGARLMIINLTPTPMDGEAHLVVHDSVSKALTGMLEALGYEVPHEPDPNELK